MAAVVQRLRETMPSYMNQQILDFLCEDKETAILNECVDYIRTHRFKDPKVKAVMSPLLEEVFRDLSQEYPKHFAELLLSEPIRQRLRIIRSSDLGLQIFLSSTFHGGYAVVCQLFKKRITETAIVVLKNGRVEYLLHDAPGAANGRINQTTKKNMEFLHRIFRAHLPHEVETMLLDLMTNNTWETTTGFIAKLFSVHIKRKHKPVVFNVKVTKGVLEPVAIGNCYMTITHTV
jgi:hypothetical protein